MMRAAVVLGLVGCTGQSGEAPFIYCPTVGYTDVAASDDTLGYSAEAVVAGLEVPTELTWEWADDEAWVGTTLPLSLSALQVGAVQIADYTGEPTYCPLSGQRVLEFDLELQIDLGEGQAVGEGSVLLQAFGPGAADVSVPGGWGPAVEVSGTLGDVVDAWWADQQTRNEGWTGGFVLNSVNASLLGPWEALELSIDAQHESDDYVSATALFRGTVGSAETAPGDP